MAVPACLRDYLDKRRAYVVTHPTAFTAQEEAAVMHLPGRYREDCRVLADNEPIAAVVPARPGGPERLAPLPAPANLSAEERSRRCTRTARRGRCRHSDRCTGNGCSWTRS
jgi:hypothetical protein